MRMVDRKTFLAMPSGTLYYQGKPWVFNGLMIKGDTLPSDDWTYCDPCGYSPEEFESMQSGEKHSVNHLYGRDGGFDATDLFIVLDLGDLAWLRYQVNAAIDVTAP